MANVQLIKRTKEERRAWMEGCKCGLEAAAKTCDEQSRDVAKMSAAGGDRRNIQVLIVRGFEITAAHIRSLALEPLGELKGVIIYGKKVLYQPSEYYLEGE